MGSHERGPADWNVPKRLAKTTLSRSRPLISEVRERDAPAIVSAVSGDAGRRAAA
jgi:hypothetical protein